jgi:hypothetical protein
MSPICRKVSFPFERRLRWYGKKIMKTYRISQVFLALMGLAFCKTGIGTLLDPQAVMNNVGIALNNPSAESSIRAVYGGMHLVFGLFCIYGIFKNPLQSLLLVVLYTIGFTIGRLSGILTGGAPNSFVVTWIIMEIACGLIAGILMMRLQKDYRTP